MKRHNYHMVESSPWPILTSFSLFFTALGGVMYIHFLKQGLTVLLVSLAFVIVVMNLWFRDAIREGTFLKEHSTKVMVVIRLGFILFIVSEVMSFFSRFILLLVFKIREDVVKATDKMPQKIVPTVVNLEIVVDKPDSPRIVYTKVTNIEEVKKQEAIKLNNDDDSGPIITDA